MKNRFRKRLTFINVFSLAIGAMISSGIFILPGLAYAKTGPSVVLSYLFAGALALTGVLNFTELSTAMPTAGGDYYYVHRSMGALLGTVSGIMSWFALSLKTAFAIFGVAKLLYLYTGWNITYAGVGVTGLFMLLNILWDREAVKLDVILVFSLLGLILVYFILGLSSVDIKHFSPFMFAGSSGIFYTSGFVFIAFGGGLLKILSVAEEIVEPQKNIPRAMIAAVVTITIFYVFLLIVTIGVLPSETLSTSLTPVALAAGKVMGSPGYTIVSFASLLAFITTANAGLMAASRYPVAISRDNLLPERLSIIHQRFHSPVYSVLLTGTIIGLSFFLPLKFLVKAASTAILVAYVFADFAVIILRESRLQNYRPVFKVPLYPWLQIASIIIFILLIVEMGSSTVEISIGLIGISVVIYFVCRKRKHIAEPALLHLISRVTDKKLSAYNLESELREILHHRDEIVLDEFDKVIAQAVVLDIAENITKEELFIRVAREFEKKYPYEHSHLFSLLCKREEEGSTAILSTVAIPHIILDEEGIFDLVLVRCKNGVYFADHAPAVASVFVIIGSKELRNLHLQALAAIAQVIQDSSFDKLWFEAKDTKLLRDIFLLSRRRRK